MASLMIEVEAARKEALRLRLDAVGLRFVAQRRTADARVRLRKAGVERARAEAACCVELPSPWSSLAWRVPARTLDGPLSGL